MSDLVPLGEIYEFSYGKGLRQDRRCSGDVPVFGSNGIVGWHNQAITSGPTIVIGRKGSIGKVSWSDRPCYPIDTTYFVDRTTRPCDLKWLYFALLAIDLTTLDKSSAVPGLNRDDAYEQFVDWPPLPEQRRIAALLDHANGLLTTRRYALELSATVRSSAFVDLFGDPGRADSRWPTEDLVS